MRKITILLDNIRSAHNVGSILRTADGLGIDEVIMCGITPYPIGDEGDERLPHIAKSAHKMIAKTALGAESSVIWRYEKHTAVSIKKLKSNYAIICLEQSPHSVSLDTIKNNYADRNIVLVLGPEVSGISDDILELADTIAEIPMKGAKESLNVSIAAAIAMYELAKA